MTETPPGSKPVKGTSTPAVQADAEAAKTIAVEFDGRTFTVPADPQDWSVGAHRAFLHSAPLDALPMLLAPGQYDAAQIDTWPARKANDLLNAIGTAVGFGSAGE
jgi:hypothetical protein